jgi:excisionase family DNA binding protein
MQANERDGGHRRVKRLGSGIAETAESIGCSPGHIRNLIARGELQSVRIGRRIIILNDELLAFLERCTAATPKKNRKPLGLEVETSLTSAGGRAQASAEPV